MSLSKENWGNNIWYLFHSIAHKIKEDRFEFHRTNLFFIIKTKYKNLKNLINESNQETYFLL